jgi:DNA-binding NarL/FixJ family response regulator
VTQAKTIRVFIAEDSDFLRDLLVRSLNAMTGVVVAGHACSGEAAIAGVRDAQPDIVLLDLAMPEGGGFAVLEALKPNGQRPFFVVLTLHTEPAFREQCRELGTHVFLDKATELQRLLDALQALAGRDFDLPELLEAFSPEQQTAE